MLINDNIRDDSLFSSTANRPHHSFTFPTELFGSESTGIKFLKGQLVALDGARKTLL